MVTDESVTLRKSEDFAFRIIRLYKFLSYEKGERVMSKQVLRSGTSIGANLAESLYGMSKRDFLTKIYISLKECSETNYWLRLLYKSEYINKVQYDSIHNDCDELMRLLTSIVKTTKKNLGERDFD